MMFIMMFIIVHTCSLSLDLCVIFLGIFLVSWNPMWRMLMASWKLRKHVWCSEVCTYLFGWSSPWYQQNLLQMFMNHMKVTRKQGPKPDWTPRRFASSALKSNCSRPTTANPSLPTVKEADVENKLSKKKQGLGAHWQRLQWSTEAVLFMSLFFSLNHKVSPCLMTNAFHLILDHSAWNLQHVGQNTSHLA